MEIPDEQSPIPWLRKEDIGQLRAIWDTLIEVTFRPHTFFRRLSVQHSVSNAFSFYITFGSILLIAAIFIFFLAARCGVKEMGPAAAVFSASPFFILLIIPLAIIGMSIAILVNSAIMHIFVLLFRGKGRFSGTFNVLVFSYVAQYFCIVLFVSLAVAFFAMKSLALLPTIALFVLLISIFIAFAIGMIWAAVILPIIGYMNIHSMGLSRAILSLLAPAIIFIIIQIAFNAAFHINTRFKAPRIMDAAFSGDTGKVQEGEIKSDFGNIKWRNSLEAALREAKTAQMPLMVDFYTDWCGWCKKLDKDTYANSEVNKLLRKFICVKIDGDKNRALVSRYNIRGYPTVIFLSYKGEAEGRIGGYLGPSEFSNIAKGILRKTAKPSSGAATVSEGSPQAEGRAKDKKFKLGGIIITPQGYKAIVNNDIVGAGDTIGGAKVIEIKKDRVRLIDGSEEVILTI